MSRGVNHLSRRSRRPGAIRFRRPVGQGVKEDGTVVELRAYRDARERADGRYSQHRR
jgi:hypothetical protein